MGTDKRSFSRIKTNVPANLYIQTQKGFVEVQGRIVDISKKGMGFLIEGETAKTIFESMNTKAKMILQTVDTSMQGSFSPYESGVLLEYFRLVWFNYTNNTLHLGCELDRTRLQWSVYVQNKRMLLEGA